MQKSILNWLSKKEKWAFSLLQPPCVWKSLSGTPRECRLWIPNLVWSRPSLPSSFLISSFALVYSDELLSWYATQIELMESLWSGLQFSRISQWFWLLKGVYTVLQLGTKTHDPLWNWSLLHFPRKIATWESSHQRKQKKPRENKASIYSSSRLPLWRRLITFRSRAEDYAWLFTFSWCGKNLPGSIRPATLLNTHWAPDNHSFYELNSHRILQKFTEDIDQVCWMREDST